MKNEKIKIIVLGLETIRTGEQDRLVTFAALKLVDLDFQDLGLHLIFNPGEGNWRNIPKSVGLDEWSIRFQDYFSDVAEPLHKWLSWADVVVLHDVAGKMPILQEELRLSGLPPLAKVYCTMERAVGHWPGQPARLDQCAARIGLPPVDEKGGAIAIAYQTMNLLLRMSGRPAQPLPSCWPQPLNIRRETLMPRPVFSGRYDLKC